MMYFQPFLTKAGGIKATQPIEVKSLWFLHRQTAKHGDTYDYSAVKYEGMLTKVKIICKIHGMFEQSPQSHVNGRGCPKCQGLQFKTTQECIQDFKKVHGDLYNYSQVKYSGQHTKVTILCGVHGRFDQQPSNHLAGQGCPKCKNHNQDTLYLMKCLTTGLVKIGITNNAAKRITEIGGNLSLIQSFTVSNPRAVEKTIHKNYGQFRQYNSTVRNGNTEFFALSEQQIQIIIEELK